MASFSATELNYMVFRYLQESGFTHSAFVLGNEAAISKTPIDGNLVPPGALIRFVQKGLHYLEMEANISNGDADAEDDFSYLQPLDILSKDVKELQRIVKERKESQQKEKQKDMQKSMDLDQKREPDRSREREKHATDKIPERGREMIEYDKVPEKEKEKDRQRVPQIDCEPVRDQEDKVDSRHETNQVHEGPEPMDISISSPIFDTEILSSEVTILEGHTSEVFGCAWSPAGLLASGSGDSTARIWTLADRPYRTPYAKNGPQNVAVLKHFKGKTNEKSKDVTALDWNGEGTLLATGSYDGQARIWGSDGELKSTLIRHKGPIFSLKWNKKGNYLLSGSVDKTAIVWDVKTGDIKQQFEHHEAPTLDVDWRNDFSFASCSTDNLIYVCKIGEEKPLRKFSGHEGEVNAIKWDPTGSLLASCSDDSTAKIWSIRQDSYLHNLRAHTKEIYTIRWSPTGPGTKNPNQKLLLASASFDSTIKIWDVEQGRDLYSFDGHREPVYAIAFDPTGEYLASGSMDKSIHIWSMKHKKIVKTYSGSGGIFEVCWSKEGDRIAACFANNTVCVLDFRM